MRRMIAIGMTLATAMPSPAHAGTLDGPGRFCGYAPIIDLLPGEKVTTLTGGIHAGSFRWDGDFGTLEVTGIGWAARPKGRVAKASADQKPTRFAQKRVDDRYRIAIWNGAHGVAYFTASQPFTPAQLIAIDRVQLFEEGENPTHCDLRTIFVWE